jgi:hypothetical protein
VLKLDSKSPIAFSFGYSAVTVARDRQNITVKNNIYVIPFTHILNHDTFFKKKYETVGLQRRVSSVLRFVSHKTITELPRHPKKEKKLEKCRN